jgi:hypothetical protein
MKLKITFSAIMVAALGLTTTQAQEIPKTNQKVDLAIGFGQNVYSGAVQYTRTHGIGQSNKFRVGYGVRFSAFGGSDLMYITAPANLTANDATIDSLSVASASTLALNAVIHLQYQFNQKFLIGFNIDAIGVGFGPETDGTFISSEGGNLPVQQTATPTSLNVLLIGDNDIGQLKSELFAAYAITEKIWLRAGLDFTFSEYTTNQILTNENDRFRFKAMLFFVGASYSF